MSLILATRMVWLKPFYRFTNQTLQKSFHRSEIICLSPTYTVLSQTLDHIVKVGTGSLPIRRQVVHLDLGLLSEDVCLNVVVFALSTTHCS